MTVITGGGRGLEACIWAQHVRGGWPLSTSCLSIHPRKEQAGARMGTRPLCGPLWCARLTAGQGPGQLQSDSSMSPELASGRNSRGTKVHEGRASLVLSGLTSTCPSSSRCDCPFWRVGVSRLPCAGRRLLLANLDLRGHGLQMLPEGRGRLGGLARAGVRLWCHPPCLPPRRMMSCPELSPASVVSVSLRLEPITDQRACAQHPPHPNPGRALSFTPTAHLGTSSPLLLCLLCIGPQDPILGHPSFLPLRDLNPTDPRLQAPLTPSSTEPVLWVFSSRMSHKAHPAPALVFWSGARTPFSPSDLLSEYGVTTHPVT